jgi:hypothetical protein
MEISMEVPQKTKNKPNLWPCNTTLGHIPDEVWINTQDRHLHTHVYCSPVHNYKTVESAKVPNNWWMDNENIIIILYIMYIYMYI